MHNRMTFRVENIDACEPINELLAILQEKGFAVSKSKVGDYHFNELYFLLAGRHSDAHLKDIDINKIEKYAPGIFYCQCHWSIVEIHFEGSK